MTTLDLPTTPELLLAEVVRPMLKLLGDKYQGEKAEVMLLAIAGQESGLRTRQQVKGPALSLWQIEPRTAYSVFSRWEYGAGVLSRMGVTVSSLTERLTTDDDVGCILARGLLWLNPRPLPEVGSPEHAWEYYAETWRPGKPRPEAWAEHYAAAVKAVGEE